MLCNGVRKMLQAINEDNRHPYRNMMRTQYQKMLREDVYQQVSSSLAHRRPLLVVAPSPNISDVAPTWWRAIAYQQPISNFSINLANQPDPIFENYDSLSWL